MNLTKNEIRYIPQRVVTLAYNLGVHAECVEADLEGACSQCLTIFHTCFDTFYGQAENENDAFMMILNDILGDNETQ